MWEYFTLERTEVFEVSGGCFAGKIKKGYKVSGNRNLSSERFWSKSKEMRLWTVVSK